MMSTKAKKYKKTQVEPIKYFYPFFNKKYIHTETILQKNFK